LVGAVKVVRARPQGPQRLIHAPALRFGSISVSVGSHAHTRCRSLTLEDRCDEHAMARSGFRACCECSRERTSRTRGREVLSCERYASPKPKPKPPLGGTRAVGGVETPMRSPCLRCDSGVSKGLWTANACRGGRDSAVHQARHRQQLFAFARTCVRGSYGAIGEISDEKSTSRCSFFLDAVHTRIARALAKCELISDETRCATR
jgi:hypothetical protein